MKPGDLVLMRFPQTDLQTGKLRPALVVALTPGRHSDLLLAFVSSRIYQTIPDFDELVSPTDVDYAQTGLKTSSVIRLARLITVDETVINAHLGHISSQRLQIIRQRLADWLDSA